MAGLFWGWVAACGQVMGGATVNAIVFCNWIANHSSLCFISCDENAPTQGFSQIDVRVMDRGGVVTATQPRLRPFWPKAHWLAPNPIAKHVGLR